MVIAGFYDWPGLSIRRNTGGICRNGLETGISRPGAAGIVYKLACGVCCKMHPALENCIQHLQFIQDAFWNRSNQINFICTKINNINDLHEIHSNFTKQGKYLLVYMTAPDICFHRMHRAEENLNQCGYAMGCPLQIVRTEDSLDGPASKVRRISRYCNHSPSQMACG